MGTTTNSTIKYTCDRCTSSVTVVDCEYPGDDVGNLWSLIALHNYRGNSDGPSYIDGADKNFRPLLCGSCVTAFVKWVQGGVPAPVTT